MVFVLDNYDSFTYNLVQYMGELGAEMVIRRNDELTPAEVENLRKYLSAGGTIIFNAARGLDEFSLAVAREMRRVFPQKQFMRLPLDHPGRVRKVTITNSAAARPGSLGQGVSPGGNAAATASGSAQYSITRKSPT